MAIELNELRDQIDAVDKQMLELLAQRLALVEKVGEVKVNTDYPFMPPTVKPQCWLLVAQKQKSEGSSSIN